MTALCKGLALALLWHFFLGIFTPLLIVLVGGAMIAFSTTKEPTPLWKRLLIPFVIATLLPVVLTLGIPVKLAAQLILSWAGPGGAGVHPVLRLVIDSGPVDLALGGMGVLLSAIALAATTRGWMRIARIRHTPSSRVRSAALGLVELFGKARVCERTDLARPFETTGPPRDWETIVPKDAVIYKDSQRPTEGGMSSTCRLVTPFYLEDATGRILIDPRGAKFGGFSTVYFSGEPPCRMALSGSQLVDGQDVYVLGLAELRSDAPAGAQGGDRLIVRAGVKPRKWFPARPHTFLLSNDTEERVRHALEEAFNETFFFFLISFACSTWLVLRQLGGAQ